MEREQLDRLLAEYATGGLSPQDKAKLFEAALDDQALFDQLMEEDALREVIDMPGARNRLIDALQEDVVEVPRAAAAILAAPGKRATPARAPWLAWAAGIGIVLASGAITYLLFEEPARENVAQVTKAPTPRETKPFVEPPAKTADKPGAKPIDSPPSVAAEMRDQIGPRPLEGVAPTLPAAPPPPAQPVVIPEREEKSADAAVPGRAAPVQPSRNDLRAPAQPARDAGAGRSMARREAPAAAPATAPATPVQTAGASAVSVASEAKTVELAKAKDSTENKQTGARPAVWRRTGDGIWTRLAEGTAISRSDTVSIRYVPASTGPVTVTDSKGARVQQKIGQAGEEVELAIPRAVLAQASGPVLTLSIHEGAPAVGGAVGGFARQRPATEPVQILLHLQ